LSRAPSTARTGAPPTLKRFSDVVRRFGPLQTATALGAGWLESLVRCADIAASQEAIGSKNAPAARETSP
jgi:hypothetical protein